jgi:hypothetical protein
VAFNRAREETPIELMPEGTLLAIITALGELGTQPAKSYGSKDDNGDAEETRYVETAFVALETVTARVAATGKPFEIVLRVNMEALGDKSTQRKLAEATGTYKKPFDITQMLGKALQIKVKHKETNGRKFANVVDSVPLGEGQQSLIKPPRRTPILWEMETSDVAILTNLPKLFGDKLEDLVKASPEWRRRGSRTHTSQPTTTPPVQTQSVKPTAAAAPVNGNGSTGKPKHKPRAVVPPPDADDLFLFAANGDELTTWKAKDLQAYIEEKQLNPHTLEVCREGEDSLRLAFEYGFTDPIPF